MAQYVYSMNRVSKTVPPKRQILKDISLSFFPGAKIGVLGLNGSGKSTLLKIMAGVDKEIEGEALPKRKAVKVSKPDDLLAALRESAGMMKAAEDKPKHSAANVHKGTGRKPAARKASAKPKRPAAARRKAG